MKLKTKRLLAAALALSLTANLSLAAFAVTYDLSEGSVTITDDDEERGSTGVWSYQDDIDNGSDDVEITITTKEVDDEGNIVEDSEADETHNTVTIDGDFSEVEDLDITIKDVDIVVDDTNDAAITIEDDSDVDITLSGDNNITLDAGGTSGIEVGAGAEVTITVDGTTDISTTYTDDKNTADNSDSLLNVDDAGNLTTGISVGGGAVDDALDGNGASLTITGTEDSDDVLNISGTSTGILVHGNSSLTIGDVDEDDADETIKVSIDDATRTYDGDEGTADEELMYYTVSGKGIMSWGNVTITKGAELEIDDSDLQGININEADLTISEGAKVTITNSGTNDSISDAAKAAGDSQSYAGIYAQNGKSDQSTITVKGDGTSLTITGSTGDGIAAEGYDVDVSDGANLTISDVAKKDATAGMNVTGGGDVTISGADTVVNVSGTGGEGGIHMSGTDDNSADLTVTDSAKLNISNTLKSGITANGNSNITMSDNAVVYMTAIDGYPIYMLGGCGNAEEGYNLLEVTSGAKLTIADWTTYDGGIMYYDNKHVLISDGAIVTLGSGTNGVHLLGNNTSLIVDNAELISGSRIVIENGNETIEIKPHIEIRNGSRVVVPYVINYSTAAEFWITGGTVELTDDKTSGTGWVGKSDSENLFTKDFWPTSGGENGDEKLTGFKLSVSELEALQESLRTDGMTDEEFFNEYGFVITEDDTLYDTTSLLIFQTYGVKDGEYYNYNAEKNNDLTSDWYVVDLNKDYGDELWVWTPAVVLSYYILDDGKTLDDAVSYDESTPWEPEGDRNDILPFVEEDVDGDGEVEYYQVDVNGNKITETDEEGNEQYVTVNLTDADKTYVLYKDGKFYKYDSETGDYTAEVEVKPGIATRATSDHDVIIRGMFLDFGNFKTNEEYETYAATSENAKTTAFADAQKAYPGYTFWVYNHFDDENVIDLDTIRVTEIDGKYYQVDEDGNVLSDEAIELKAENTYVLYEDGKFYLIDENGEKVCDSNDEPIVMVNGEWVPFTGLQRIRSDSATDPNDVKNYKNIFAPRTSGGGDTPTDPTKPEDPTDPGTPETPPETPPTDEPGTPDDEPREPEEPLEPDTPVVPVVPVTPETPAEPGTPGETPNPDAPAAPAEPGTPASSTPKTGDDSNVAIYLVVAALSGAALIGLGVTGKKKNEEF